jgi:hypothetical protein
MSSMAITLASAPCTHVSTSILNYTTMKGFEERAAPGGVYESFLAELKHEPDLLSNAELVGDVTLPANVFRVQQWGFNSVFKVSNSSDEGFIG